MKEQIELKENELSKLYQELKNNIEEAEYLIGRLGNYTWEGEYSFLAYMPENKYGVRIPQRWLTDILPSDETIVSVEKKMNSIKGIFPGIWRDRPYIKPQSAEEKAGEPSPDQWKQQCAAINNDLIDLKQAILIYKTEANKMINKVNEVLITPKFKDRYHDEFINDSNEFNNMIDELIQIMDKAIESATAIENWVI